MRSRALWTNRSRWGLPEGRRDRRAVGGGHIFAAASRLIYENTRVLMDTAPDDASEKAEAAIGGLGDVVELRRLRLRESGGLFRRRGRRRGAGSSRVREPRHRRCRRGSRANRLTETDVVVHWEPSCEGLDLRDRVLATAIAEPLSRGARHHDLRT